MSKPVLNPWFITGYTDGEGCFSIGFDKRLSSPSGFKIYIIYQLCAEVNPLNKELLELVKEYFGVGIISKTGNMYYYHVKSLKSAFIIRKHFEEFPLQTTKFVHFKLWCQVMDIIEKKKNI